MDATAPAVEPALPRGGGAEIRLEGLSKIYPDGTVGVAELDLTFAAGELTVLADSPVNGKMNANIASDGIV